MIEEIMKERKKGRKGHSINFGRCVICLLPVLCLSMMLPVPRSPEDENLMPSFVTAMLQVSPRTPKSVFVAHKRDRYETEWWNVAL